MKRKLLKIGQYVGAAAMICGFTWMVLDAVKAHPSIIIAVIGWSLAVYCQNKLYP